MAVVEAARTVHVSTRAREPERRVLMAVRWALYVVPPITYLLYLALNDPSRWLRFIDDDAYYYLGVARNMAEGHGSTFAGLTETNGYQPLWLLVLVPLALVLRSPDALIVGVVLLQCLIWVGTVREGLRIGRKVADETTALGALACLGLFTTGIRHLSFGGLETGLLVFLVLVAIRLVLELEEDAPVRAYRSIGVVLALISLTRLDAAATAAALGIVVAWRVRHDGERVRYIAALAGPTALALAAYFVVNQVVFGIPLPVSGQAKALGGPFFGMRPVRDSLETGSVGAIGMPTWLGAITLILTVVALAAMRRHRTVPPAFAGVLGAVLAGEIGLLVYLSAFSSYGALPWYQYDIAILLYLAALPLLPLALRLSRPLLTAGVVVACSVVLVGGGAGVYLSESNMLASSVPGAEFVARELPRDATLAMGDRAGAFGYYAERPLLHLEGLTADASYLDDLAADRALARMEAEGVDYYVRYSNDDLITRSGSDCWRIGEPSVRDDPLFEVVVCDEDVVYSQEDTDGVPLTIWRYRPELQDQSSGSGS